MSSHMTASDMHFMYGPKSTFKSNFSKIKHVLYWYRLFNNPVGQIASKNGRRLGGFLTTDG